MSRPVDLLGATGLALHLTRVGAAPPARWPFAKSICVLEDQCHGSTRPSPSRGNRVARPRLRSRLNAEIQKTLAKSEILARYASMGCEVAGPGTPEQMDRYVREQLESWRVKIRDAGIQSE